MAKKKSVQKDGDAGEVEFFDENESESLPDQKEPAKVVGKDDIKNHSKFDKFKGEK